MKSLEELLDDLAAYVDVPEESCVSLPPDAYLSPDLNALEVRAIFERSWLCVGREEYAPKPRYRAMWAATDRASSPTP